MTNLLDSLAVKYKTDKATQKVGRLAPKGYTLVYSKFFESIREAPMNILEIGVAEGASVKMWEEYFPNSTIYGIDINPACKKYESGRVKIRIGDQTDTTFLKSVCEEANNQFGIIIDDGGHFMNQHIVSLEFLFDYVVSKGFYAIEDVHTCYSAQFGGGLQKHDSSIEYLKTQIDFINVQNAEPVKASGRENSDIMIHPIKNLESISFYKSVIMMTKS